MAQISGPAIGVAVGDTNQRDTVQKAPLGSTAQDKLGNVYRYVKAGASIAAFDAVRFQGSTLGFDDVRPTSAAAQPVVGIAQAAFASGDYGYVLIDGVGSCKTTGSVAANVQLVSSGTAGTLAAYANTDITAPAVTVLVSAASPQVVKVAAL